MHIETTGPRRRIRLNDVAALARARHGIDGRPEFSDLAVFVLLHRESGRAIKGVRKGRKESFAAHIPNALAWAALLASRKGVADIEATYWEAYPGVCPYCLKAPCICCRGTRSLERATPAPSLRRPRMVRGFQLATARIYPPIDAVDTVGHLAEELAELHAAFFQEQPRFRLSEREGAPSERPFVVELVDVLTHLFKIAVYMEVDLESELRRRFSEKPARFPSLEELLGDGSDGA